MKKYKVYLKDVKCPYCGFMHDELRVDDLDSNWSPDECSPILRVFCNECKLHIFIWEKDIDFGE